MVSRRDFILNGLTATAAAVAAAVAETAWGAKAAAQTRATQTSYPADPLVSAAATTVNSMPRAAAISIGDMLDHALRVKTGIRF